MPHLSLPGKSWLLSALGVTHGRRSLYDELMLSLHDTAKLDSAYQQNSPRQEVKFPPGCCWLVFTDQVLHAALGGEFALEQTFHLDVSEMTEPERADKSLGTAERPPLPNPSASWSLSRSEGDEAQWSRRATLEGA